MYAIIETCGKQYRVEPGAVVVHEKIDGYRVGEAIKFDKVLLVVDENGPQIGTPYLKGATITGVISEAGLDEKVIIYKYKPKKGYRRKRGHRQPYMSTLIKTIEVVA
ncbi:50S ribosomal protein L21 [Candidatus Acetothermia bacterium]|jgi:large subunit ribosomal protein L21|nr:50S ribosomal protein L21 [Candidatus Acetothermia bacterium]MCI2427207.1 50S ribosomal protein L21 [Candidatus Acetothermia bacterium]MCI2428595.1 50S ribosomal protein L21 [Candidatus Acetothermia bacterium]